MSFEGNNEVDGEADSRANSWSSDFNVGIDDGDFLSLDDAMLTEERNPDGSLPQNDFLRLAPSSDGIDAGERVGLSYSGNDPDLGAFEYRPDESNSYAVTCLHQAVRDGDSAKIRSLLAGGADVNEKDWLGYTPLHWSVYFGYRDFAGILISEGADTQVRSDSGQTPFDLATKMAYEEIADLLYTRDADK